MSIVDEIRAAGQAIASVIATLNQSRSMVIEVDNNTDATLQYSANDHHDLHGGYSSSLPHASIGPRSADVFGSQSSAWSLFTGCEGTSRYHGDGFNLDIHWDNPFIGSNSADSRLSGPSAVLYETAAIVGNGNANALVRFVVSPSTRYFAIVNQQTNKALDVPGGALGDHVEIQQFSEHNGPNQEWRFFSVGGGYFVIVNQHSQKALDVPGGATGDGVHIQQFTRHNGPNQQWRVIPAGPWGTFEIVNRQTGKALDIPSGNPADHVKLQQFTENGGANQRWKLIPVG